MFASKRSCALGRQVTENSQDDRITRWIHTQWKKSAKVEGGRLIHVQSVQDKRWTIEKGQAIPACDLRDNDFRFTANDNPMCLGQIYGVPTKQVVKLNRLIGYGTNSKRRSNSNWEKDFLFKDWKHCARRQLTWNISQMKKARHS